ncbi:MAG: zinc ribbon domain-containing protein [Gammaproteobacteria bacterium]|nr:MAG: zinc ribbon domain-containing protein [Gammaproteobacteria bacterium]
MPIYEYQCKECDHRLEALQNLNDPPLTRCPECGKETLEKVLSVTGFQLKGGGWYKDGYASKQEKKEAPACGQGACPACSD